MYANHSLQALVKSDCDRIQQGRYSHSLLTMAILIRDRQLRDCVVSRWAFLSQDKKIARKY